jgi:hypothetical protein
MSSSGSELMNTIRWTKKVYVYEVSSSMIFFMHWMNYEVWNPPKTSEYVIVGVSMGAQE